MERGNMRKDQEFYNRLGWALRSQRGVKKVAVEDIAKILEVSAQQIQKYETGKDRIPVDKLTSYCEVLKIKPQWILEWSKGKELGM